jgi:hypothetical protein
LPRMQASDNWVKLGRFLRPQAKLDNLSRLSQGNRPQRFPKVLRYVKLNNDCHCNLLLMSVLWGDAIGFQSFQSPSPYHIHPQRHRTESDNRSLYNSALQTAHDLIHTALLPRTRCAGAVAGTLVPIHSAKL